MNEQYVYFFVRQDIPLAQQSVQSLHAALAIASINPIEGIPNVVFIGVPTLRDLEEVKARLEKYQLPKYCYIEPDFDFGFTAIATAPLRGKQRRPLRHYEPWTYGRGAGQPACGLTPDSLTMRPDTQDTASLS